MGAAVRSWTATVTGPWGVSVRYDCSAVDGVQARAVIAQLALCVPGEVHDLARTCGIFTDAEAGDPR